MSLLIPALHTTPSYKPNSTGTNQAISPTIAQKRKLIPLVGRDPLEIGQIATTANRNLITKWANTQWIIQAQTVSIYSVEMSEQTVAVQKLGWHKVDIPRRGHDTEERHSINHWQFLDNDSHHPAFQH